MEQFSIPELGVFSSKWRNHIHPAFVSWNRQFLLPIWMDDKGFDVEASGGYANLGVT